MAVLYWRVFSLSTNLRHEYRSTYRPNRPPKSKQITITIYIHLNELDERFIIMVDIESGGNRKVLERRLKWYEKIGALHRKEGDGNQSTGEKEERKA